MNKLYAVLLVNLICALCQAQARINRPDTSMQDIRERLVRLALQNPNYEIADRRVNIASYELEKAKGDWLSPVVPTVNLNEFTLRRRLPGEQIFFPLYNIGIAVPLNFFTQRRNEVRIARENLSVAEAQKNQQFRLIRAEVLARYEDFLMYRARLERHTRITQDENLAFLQAEKDFADGLIDIATYNKAYQNLSLQLDRKEEIQRNYNVAKLQLEEMIGVPIEQVYAMN